MPVSRVYLQTWISSKSPWEIFQQIHRPGRKAFFLDSIHYQGSDQQYSYLAADPFLTLRIEKGKLQVRGEKNQNYPAKKLLIVLRALLKEHAVAPSPPPSARLAFGGSPLPRGGEGKGEGLRFFTGGVVGYWGYELAPLFDKIQLRRKPAAGTPELLLGFFREVVVYDHKKKHYYLSVCAKNKKQAREGFSKLQKMVGVGFKPAPTHPFSFRNFRLGLTKEKFCAMVRRAKHYIEAGDIYQANLSQRFTFQFKGSSLGLYAALRGINPSPFASYFSWDDIQIISSSPERLVKKSGRYCETKPIAGTRPRPKDSRRVQALRRELLINIKECAEHIMLVDLERNDLGRVCDFKSIQVKELMKVKMYSHVMHLVSKITGRLRPDKDALDLLKAVFPGGTITGCPKIRCMEIIDELEPVQRGIYTGSIGYLDFKGDMDLNIVIRTLILRKNRGHLQVGAGIVYDSDPQCEYDETLHKGEALVEALVMASRGEVCLAPTNQLQLK